MNPGKAAHIVRDVVVPIGGAVSIERYQRLIVEVTSRIEERNFEVVVSE